jgi:hypothetical protein
MSTQANAEIQSKINKLQALIDNPNTPENDKKNFQDAIKKFKDKLTTEKKEEPKKEEPKPNASVKKPIVKSKPKKTVKTDEKKVPKGVQMVSKKKFVIDGKEMDVDSKEFCDYLTDEFIKRKEQAKKNKGTRKKTKSVMASVSDKIEKGVETAIKKGISSNKPILQKNPKVFIGKVQKLETATKNFLTQLKEVLGSEYDAKEVTETTKAIHKLIEDLKKKFDKK